MQSACFERRKESVKSASLKLGKCQEYSFFRGGLKGHAGKHEKEEGDVKIVCVCVSRTVKGNLFVCEYKDETGTCVISPHTGPRTFVAAGLRSAGLSR